MLSIDLNLFACPVTKEKLTLNNNALNSSFGSFFQTEFGCWDFIPYGLPNLNDNSWKIWEKLQQNGEIMYMSDPSNNLGVGKRNDFFQFSEFCNFNGLILDIGVGPQKQPTHIEFCKNKNAQFIGIDPLIGEQPKEYSFVRGLGEYLPFQENLFDQVIYVTSLDHFIDPINTLSEARRIIKPSGEICIWIGEKAKDAPKPIKSNPIYESLQVPTGADDKFHYKRLTATTTETCLNQLHLKIIEKEITQVNEWRQNLFYRIKK